MRKTKPMTTLDELDDDLPDSKSQRRPLQPGEIVPAIPSLYEQLEMAARAAQGPRARSR